MTIRTLKRKSLRLREFDYSSEGAYAVTICSDDLNRIFGRIESNQVVVSPIGAILIEEFMRSNFIRDEIFTDYFAVMPNHFHAIIFIQHNEPMCNAGLKADAPSFRGVCPDDRKCDFRRTTCGLTHQSLSSFVAGFKSAVTSRVRKMLGNTNFVVWKRNYFEHVIRDEQDLLNQRQYIENNPMQWALDEFYRG